METSLFVHPGFMQAASEELPGEGSGGVRARFLGLGAAAQGPGRARGDLPAVCTWSRDVRCLSNELRTRGRVLALDAGIREGPIETGSDYGRCR
jgi:hypothetical protein